MLFDFEESPVARNRHGRAAKRLDGIHSFNRFEKVAAPSKNTGRPAS
jgi:hypothetical protein